jgi:hypothetical protein
VFSRFRRRAMPHSRKPETYLNPRVCDIGIRLLF